MADLLEPAFAGGITSAADIAQMGKVDALTEHADHGGQIIVDIGPQ